MATQATAIPNTIVSRIPIVGSFMRANLGLPPSRCGPTEIHKQMTFLSQDYLN